MTKYIVLALATVLAGDRHAYAYATDSEEAEALIAKGVELRQQGRDERALPLFQKAYQLATSPRTAGQLGFAEMAVGYWLDSEQHLGEALETPDHPWVAKNHDILTKALAQVRSNIGEITIEGPPRGATVSVNGHEVGTFPLAAPIRAGKGKVDLEVRAEGYEIARRSLHIGGADRQQIIVVLERTPDNRQREHSPLAAAPTPASPAPALSQGPPAVPTAPLAEGMPSSPPSTDVRQPAGHRTAGLVLGVAAGAALVGAVVETVIWQSKRSDYNNTAGCYEDQPNRGAPGCSSLFNTATQAETIAIIGYALAGALTVGSAALLLTEKPPEAQTRSALTCAPGLGKSLVSCRLAF